MRIARRSRSGAWNMIMWSSSSILFSFMSLSYYKLSFFYSTEEELIHIMNPVDTKINSCYIKIKIL